MTKASKNMGVILIGILAVICLFFSGAGYAHADTTNTTGTAGYTGLANPFVSYDTLDDAIAGAGFSFTVPTELAEAGTWQQNSSGWWFAQNDGKYPKKAWKWIQGKCYYFDKRGYCFMGGKTADGNTVNQNGEWTEKGEAVTDNSKGMLAGWIKNYIQAIPNNTIQVSYKNGDAELLLRKAKGTEDISGDYNTYAENTTEDVNGMSVKLRGSNGKVSTAVWTSGGYSYAIDVSNSAGGMDKDTILSFIKEMK